MNMCSMQGRGHISDRQKCEECGQHLHFTRCMYQLICTDHGVVPQFSLLPAACWRCACSAMCSTTAQHSPKTPLFPQAAATPLFCLVAPETESTKRRTSFRSSTHGIHSGTLLSECKTVTKSPSMRSSHHAERVRLPSSHSCAKPACCAVSREALALAGRDLSVCGCGQHHMHHITCTASHDFVAHPRQVWQEAEQLVQRSVPDSHIANKVMSSTRCGSAP